MVNYMCQTCGKQFNRKSNYDYHTENKKNPCIPISQKFKNIPEHSEIFQNIKYKQEDKETNIEHECCYCGKIFSTGFNLNKHIKNNCKIKKEDDDNKKNIFELLLEKERVDKERIAKEKDLLNNQLLYQNKEINELKNQLLDLTRTIKEL